MSPRRRAAAALAVVATVLSGGACRWYALERRLDPANADFLSKVRYIISGEERRAFLLCSRRSVFECWTSTHESPFTVS